MNKTTPFIKKFKTNSNYYIYDVNTNRILLATKVMHDIASYIDYYSIDEIYELIKDKYDELPKSEFEATYRKLKYYKHKYDLFSTTRPKARGFLHIPTIEMLQQHYEHSPIQMLTLEITQQCNLRCRYCIYSGKYACFRTHRARHMSFEVAEKGLRFYFDRSLDKLSISFYGGEPLLNFNVIKKCIDIIKIYQNSNKHKETNIRVCTNGVLLDTHKIKYFVDNEVDIQISLDGPKNHHDRYRVMKDGKGTFDIMRENLAHISSISRSYYKEHVMFVCTITPTSNLEEMNEFFINDSLINSNYLMVGKLFDKETIFFNNCEYNAYQGDEYASLKNKYFNIISRKENKRTFLDHEFERSYVRLYKRNIYDHPREETHLLGPCMPGQRKLYVSCDGKIYPCERINSYFTIGDIDKGYDFNKIRNMWTDYMKIMNRRKCLGCWAMHLCGNCFATLAKKGTFSLSDSFSDEKRFCRNTRKNHETILREFATILEINPEVASEWENVISM